MVLFRSHTTNPYYDKLFQAKPVVDRLKSVENIGTSVIPVLFTKKATYRSRYSGLLVDILPEIICDFLVENGFSTLRDKLNACSSSKCEDTPLTLAAQDPNKNQDVFISLLNAKADVNATNKLGNTALHILATLKPADNASCKTIIRLIDELLNKGANLSLKNTQDKTPLELAHNERIIEKLMNNSDNTSSSKRMRP